jgi:hypothetical protein
MNILKISDVFPGVRWIVTEKHKNINFGKNRVTVDILSVAYENIVKQIAFDSVADTLYLCMIESVETNEYA